MVGWIKLHRSLSSWEWYDDINATRLLVHLLISVNYEDKKWKGITIKAGSMVLSWDSLSVKSGLSVSQCRTSMRKLISSNEVTKEVTSKFQVITLVKWDKLQSNEVYVDRQMTGDLTDKSQTSDRQVTDKSQQLKNTNNIRIKEIKNSLLSEIKISDLVVFENSDKIELYFKQALLWQKLFIKNAEEKNTPISFQKKAKFKDYVDPIRLMYEKDEVSKEQLRKVYEFLKSDKCENESFSWKATVRSTKNLRKKFETLSIRANAIKKEKTYTGGNR